MQKFLTARKDPIGSTNHQWRKRAFTDGSFTLYKITYENGEIL